MRAGHALSLMLKQPKTPTDPAIAASAWLGALRSPHPYHG
jgi:hypothetical protein